LTYDAHETSASDGYVVELFEFIGTFNTYRYTSFARDYTYLGDVYTAIAGLRRKTVKATTSDGASSSDLELEMPFDLPVAIEYAFTDTPPQLNFTLYRGHVSDPDGEFRVMWTGEASTWSVKGRQASLKIPSAFAVALDNIIPSRRWQGPCNHLLYDGRCAVVKAAFSTITTITAFSTNQVSVASLSWSGTEGIGGEVLNNSTGERRTIIAHSGTLITLKLPFSQLTIGDSVTVSMGCDHSAATCRDKFSNLDNFGGFPLIPSLNPFGSTLR